MAQGQGSRHSIVYIVESTFDTTPALPTMITLPHTGSTLRTNKNTFVSEQIRNDRQIEDLRHGVRRAAGEISFELNYGDFDTFLEAALQGAWSTNVLKAGTTAKYLTIERQFNDISEFWPFSGCMVDTFSLDIQPDAIVTGAFGIVGSGTMTPSATTAANSTTAASGNKVFDAFSGSITEGGASANVTSLTMELQNNLAPSYIIGSNTAPQILSGRSVLTGSLTAFFETEALVNKFLGETESSLSLTLQGIDGGDLQIDVPRIKYTEASVDVTNVDDGLLVNMPWQAMRDATEATNLKLTRTPA